MEILRPNTVLERSWQYILVDFITKLLVSRGHDSDLVVCNRFSKISHFYSDNRKNNGKEVIKVV